MTSEEFKEVLDILSEYAKTKTMCIDHRQEKLIKKYAEIMSNEKQVDQRREGASPLTAIPYLDNRIKGSSRTLPPKIQV